MGVINYTSAPSFFVGLIAALTNVGLFFLFLFLGRELQLLLGYEHWTSLAQTIAVIALFLGSLIAAGLVGYAFATRFFHPLSSFLYVRLSLRTPITWRDALYLAFLLSPNDTKRWYPMREVRQLPVGERREALLKEAARIYRTMES
jgi:hypothetical protein